MKVSGILSASSRRVMMAVGMAVLLVATASGRALAQDAPKPAEPPDPLKFDYDGPMILVYQIKPERVADFEAFWPELRAALAKSPKADLKAFSETLTPFKVKDVPGLYLFKLDPPSKVFTYNPGKLVYDNVNYQKPEEGLFTREQADALYKKFDGSPVGIQPWKLEKMGGALPLALLQPLPLSSVR